MPEKVLSVGQAPVPFPSGASTRSAYIRAAVLGGFSELVAAAGGDAALFARRAGLPERALRDPDMIIAWTAVAS